MLFQALKESDLDLLKKYLPQYGDGDCDLSLVSLFSRGIHNHFRYFEFESTHLVLERLVGKDPSPGFVMPIGKEEIHFSLFEFLDNAARQSHRPLRFYGRAD